MLKENDRKSFILYIVSLLIIGSVGIFRKFIPISSASLAFARGLLGALVLIIVALIKQVKLNFNIGKKNFILLLITGALLSFNWMFLFEAFNYTSVAKGTLFYYLQPTITVLVSPIIFKESLTLKKIFFATIAILGMVLVSGVLNDGGIGTDDSRGIFYATIAAFIYASIVIMNKLVVGVNAYEKTIIQLFTASIAMFIYLLVKKDFSYSSIQLKHISMILLVGLVHTGLFYVLYFKSMEGLKAQTIALFSYIDPIEALILSALVLGEGLQLSGLIGAVMIIASAILSEYKFEKQKS